jgi:hypothetical protein
MFACLMKIKIYAVIEILIQQIGILFDYIRYVKNVMESSV